MAKKKSSEDKEFVETVVKSLVGNPDDVEVKRSVDEMGVLLSVSVNPEDMGIIIGRNGRNARALRTLARVVGAKNDARVNLRIEEPEGGKRAKKKKESKDVDEAVEDLDL